MSHALFLEALADDEREKNGMIARTAVGLGYSPGVSG